MKTFVPSSWAKSYDACIICHSTASPHVAHGMCRRCYNTQRTDTLCACGCGTSITKRGNILRQFVKGHWLKSSGNVDKIRKDMHGENNPQFGKFGKEHPSYGHATSQKTREERRARRLAAISSKGKTTGIEIILSDLLDGMGIVHHPQTTLYNKFSVDEYLPDFNLVIEAYGGYWHGDVRRFPILSEQQTKIAKKDRSKEKYLNTCGHRLLILWENELLHHRDWCVSEIKLAISEHLIPLTQDSIYIKS